MLQNMTLPNAQFSDYKTVIQQHSLQKLFSSNLLRITAFDSLQSFYAPFDTINPHAKIVLVGIAPGQLQWRNAVTACKDALQQGYSDSEALSIAKATGAFSGPLRQNLIKILDHVGLHEKLRIATTAELFLQQQHLVQHSSLLRQCILNNGKNYTGTSPNMLRNAFLRQHVEHYFIPQIQNLPDALYIPLGQSVIEVLHYLSSLGYLNRNQILDGFPHPSGANAERIQYFLNLKTKDQLSNKTNPEKIDQAKQQLIEKLERLEL